MANASKQGKEVKVQKVQNGQIYALKEDETVKRPRPQVKKPKAPAASSSTTEATLPVDPTNPDNKGTPSFMIVSSDPANWRFNVGSFHPQRRIYNQDEVQIPSVEIQDFQQPVKMNRKQPKSMLYAEPEPTEVKDQHFKPMLGPDGKPVYHNGQVVMVNSEGQTLASIAKAKEKAAAAAAAAGANAKGKGKATDALGKGKKSQPKTRQVFIQSDDVRARRREEYHPWVMEDTSGNQNWIGTMDDRNDDSLWGLLKVSGGCFEFIPIHRFYSFKPHSQIVANVRADDATSKTPDFSQVYKARMGNAGSSTVVARIERQEKKEQKQAMRRPPKEEDDLFGGDGEGDIDEFEFEKEASDDEEAHRPDEIAEDEEEKESKERLKREYLGDTHAGRQAESDDEDAELDEMLMKALKARGEVEDDSDEDDYGVKKEEDDDTTMNIATGVQQQAPTPKAPTPTPAAKPSAPAGGSNAMDVDSAPATTSPVKASGSLMDFTPTAPRIKSRGGSPASSGVGAALLAKRATSPKPTGPGRAGSPQVGRAGSPLAGNAGRAISPAAPTASTVAAANAATADAKKNKKRKEAPEGGEPMKSPTAATTPGGTVNKKKRLDEAGTHAEAPSVKNLVEVLKANGGINGYVSAKTLASHYQTKHHPEYKKSLIQLIKQVANITTDGDGVQRIQLKPEYA
ncbi:hypothetical protein FRB90_006159 [Tulasnella sp. 427]|nr:hypothetical protein FRB90_006159 [Tulasnella sp. 427]